MWIYWKNTLYIDIIDTDKFMYEKGYSKTITRKLSRNMTFKFYNEIFDASEVNGIKSAMKIKG